MVAIIFSAQRLVAQDQPAAVDPADYAKLFEQFATPGPPHAEFKKLEGNWKTKSTMFEDPTNPQVSEGTAEFRVILGGRYLQQLFHGEFAGQKFEGMGLQGYDNAKKKFVSSWIDTMGTGILNTEGVIDEKTQTMTETGEMATPIGAMKMRMITKYDSDDQFTLTMFTTIPNVGEMKTMEIVYTRMK